MRLPALAAATAAVLALLALPAPHPASAQDGRPAEPVAVHAIAEFGEPALPPGFAHFPYVRPDAPRGGRITVSEPGTFSPNASFDSLNLIPLRGQPAWPVALSFEPLFAASADEIGVSYGLLAESATLAPDLSWAEFRIDPRARWHDGVPVTAEDVAWTFRMIREHGRPFLRAFYQDVADVEVLDERRVRFSMRTRDLMKPIANVAGLSVQPRHWWTSNGRDISQGTLEPILGSGPYRVAAVDSGRSLTLERVRDHWAADHPVNVGRHNFDRIDVLWFRDDDVRFEAFLAGAYDARSENRAQRWVRGYDVPAVRDGRIVRLEIPDERPKGAQGFRFNQRRERFADPRVREGLAQLFDFRWIRENLLSGQYRRTASNFPNSEFGASGPPTPAEIALLEPFRDRLDPRVFSEPFDPPSGDGTGQSRAALREAFRLFREAGWEVRNGRMTNVRTGEVFRIEFLDDSQTMARIVQPYVEWLRRAGIEASIRIVDSAQMQRRQDDFDFDALVVNFNFFPPPGPELRSYFGSAAAAQPGSANLAGIRDPVADALIEKVVEAPDIEALKAASRALDRVLLWGWHMVPQWYSDTFWIAAWDRFGRPERTPRYASGFFDTWWARAR